MSLFYQHDLSADTRLAVWKLEEPEPFFASPGLTESLPKNAYKRLQHLAGRFLLRYLYPELNLESIEVSKSGKPFLPDRSFQFSISHSGNFAAAIVSRNRHVGIDVELETPRIHVVGPKFLGPDDMKFVDEHAHLPALQLQLMTLLWSAKESMFKWYGLGGVDFKSDMKLKGPLTFHSDEHMDMNFQFGKSLNFDVKVQGRIFSPLVLTWVVADHPYHF